MRLVTLAVLAALSLITPLTCAADTEAKPDLSRFLQPLQAQVIMPLEEGILIDKGGADHVAPGDMFATVTSEKRLTHPQTGQLLDTILTYGAMFEVTRVKQNLAYCKPLDTLQQPATGTEIRRFENIPVTFEDQPGQNFQLFRSLREKLPHLRWGEYVTGSAPTQPRSTPTLLIRYTGKQLQLFNQSMQILFSQPLQLTSSGQPGTSDQTRLPAPLLAPSIPVNVSGQLRPAAASPGSLIRVKLPPNLEIQALKISDINQDGQAEAILGFSSKLLVGRLNDGEFTEESRLGMSKKQQISDISVLDLDHDGQPEIIVSAVQENELHSTIYRYTQKSLLKVTESRLLFATFTDTAGQKILLATNENSLLGQKPVFYRIQLKGNRILKTPYQLPAARQPYGISKITNNQGQTFLVQISAENRLKVTNSEGDELWISGDYYGGSTAYLKVPQPGSRNIGDDEKLFLNSTLKRTSTQTLLVTKHKGASCFKNSPDYKNGRIVELRWNGYTLEEISVTENMGGRIADFDQADVNNDGIVDLIAAVSYKSKGFFSKPVSGLVIVYNNKP